jgi:membrane protein DedA with SNARE-associated domain
VLDKAALFVYLGIFSALVAAGLGFPIPEEVPIVTAGALAGHSAEDPPPDVSLPKAVAALSATPQAGFPLVPLVEASQPDLAVRLPAARVRLHWWILLPICVLGVVISDGLLYGSGRFWGPRLLDTAWMKRLISPERRTRIEDNFHKYGVWVLLFARCLPTIRSPIFIMAGIMRVPVLRFLLADGLYAIPGVSLLFFLAFWFGDQFRDLIERLEGRVHTARPILILLALAAVAAYLIYHFLRHPLATGDPREDIPVIGGQVAKTIGPVGNPVPTQQESKWPSTQTTKPNEVSRDGDQQPTSPASRSPDSSGASPHTKA